MNLTNFTPKKSILVWIFVFVLGSTMFAQICGTKFSAAQMQKHYSLLNHTNDSIPQDTCLNKTFSLVIHIVLDSSGERGITALQLSKGIDTLNKYFAPICVKFSNCIIKEIKDYNYNKWDSTTHQPVVLATYHDINMINIYLVEGINVPGGAAGYAATGNDLIVIKKSDFASLVSVHEMGHFFGLPHTFESTVPEPVIRGAACHNSGDGFCDTDADPYDLFPQTQSSIMPCGYKPGTRDAQGQYYTPPLDNIMSYWGCAKKLTQEQYNFMAYFIITEKNYLH